MSKHTPGPWYAVSRMVEIAGSAPDICTTNPRLFGQAEDERDFDEQLANARLIAAAPDLLAMLRTCRIYINVIQDLAEGVDDAPELLRDIDEVLRQVGDEQ